MEPLLQENHFSFNDETAFCLSWENVSVTAKFKSAKFLERVVRKLKINRQENEDGAMEILKSARGYAEVGQMVAIIGPSGAGKTTLLDVLAKKIQPTSGSVRINGVEISSEKMSKISSYVPQFDPLPAFLTAGEFIDFSCALRLDRRVTAEERKALARHVLENFNLGECRDTLTCKLSGGEKKRLSLAAEILTKPKMLFLDEPTTGLDISAALHVVESIKPISESGIVVCSIHQPSMIIYNLFSHVIFLSDGKTAFSGSLENARTFFESEGIRCPFGFDEAQFYVKILSNVISRTEDFSDGLTSLEDNNRLTRICRAYDESHFSDFPSIRRDSRDFYITIVTERPDWLVQFNWLLWRLYHENRRTIIEGFISFNYFAISVSLVVIFFWGIDTRRQRGIQDVMGLLYMSSAETIFSTAYTPLYEIEREIPIFMRENAMYCPSAYYVAILVSWVPKTILKSLLLTTMLFIVVGTRDTFIPTFFQFMICTIFGGLCGLAYGGMIAAFVEDNELATIVMVPIDLAALLMSGIFYNLSTLTWYTVGLKYLSVFFYTNEALAIAHWSRVDNIECEVDDVPCISSGSEVLARYGFDESNFWPDILGMSLLTFVMNFIGYLGMRRRRRLKPTY